MVQSQVKNPLQNMMVTRFSFTLFCSYFIYFILDLDKDDPYYYEKLVDRKIREAISRGYFVF
jgi:hypothetical protein